jgi:hypothetical protein
MRYSDAPALAVVSSSFTFSIMTSLGAARAATPSLVFSVRRDRHGLSRRTSKMIPNYFIYEISEGNSAVKAKSFQVAWYFVRAISQLVPETDYQVS